MQLGKTLESRINSAIAYKHIIRLLYFWHRHVLNRAKRQTSSPKKADTHGTHRMCVKMCQKAKKQLKEPSGLHVGG